MQKYQGPQLLLYQMNRLLLPKKSDNGRSTIAVLLNKSKYSLCKYPTALKSVLLWSIVLLCRNNSPDPAFGIFNISLVSGN